MRCALATLLITRPDAGDYASFLETATRAREAFALARPYPHVAFHEADLPAAHKARMAAAAPHLLFDDVSDLFARPRPAARTAAADRDLGYRHMCRFYAWQVFERLEALGFDAVMRVDDDVFFLDRVPYDPSAAGARRERRP